MLTVRAGGGVSSREADATRDGADAMRRAEDADAMTDDDDARSLAGAVYD